jgi:hypothetical protein
MKAAMSPLEYDGLTVADNSTERFANSFANVSHRQSWLDDIIRATASWAASDIGSWSKNDRHGCSD